MPMAALAAVLPAVLSGVTIEGGALAFSLTWGSLLMRVGLALVLTGLETVLQPKPKSPSASASSVATQNYTQTVKQAVTPRRIVYGQILTSGPIAYMGVSSSNQYLHLVVLLAAHEVDSIDEVWINGDVIANDDLDSSGNVAGGSSLDATGKVITGKYNGYVRIKKHLGNPNQIADSDLVAECPEWTTDHRLCGIAYIYVRIKYDQSLFSGVPNIAAVVRGKKLYDPRDGGTRFSTNGALVCRDYMASRDYGFGAAVRNLSDDNISAQGNIADEIVDTDNYDIDITSVSADKDTLTLGNITTLGNDKVTMCPVQTGDRVQIVTSGTPPGGLSTGTDYYVFVYQFSLTIRVKLAASLADAMAQNAIDITDAGSGSFTLRRTGEPRYHGAGIVDTSKQRKNNFQDMLTMIAGKCVYANGVWTLLCGAWNAAATTFTEDDFAAPVQLQTKLSMTDRFNQVQGNYVSSINSFQPGSYPIVSNSSFISDDNQVPILKQLDLPFTNRPLTAQRIALIGLLQSRQEITVTSAFNLKGMLVQAGDVIGLDSTRYGWTAKNFEITQWGLSASANNNGNAPALQVPVTLRETDSSVYTWDSSFGFETAPAPRSNLPNPFVVAGVTGFAFNSRAVSTVGGDTVYNIYLSWDAIQDQFVASGGHFQIQFKLSSESVWRPYPQIPGNQTAADIVSSTPNAAYDVRIRAVNNLGVASGWSTIYSAVVGSSGGVGTELDYGSFTETVGTSLDYGSFTDSVGTTSDYGSFA